MLIHSNIDKHEASKNTKAPFMGHCDLDLGGYSMTPNSFLSVKIYMSEGLVPPARIDTITTDRINFTDSSGTFIGSVFLPDESGNIYKHNSGYPYLSTYIFNDNKVVVGHVTTLQSTPLELQNAAKVAGGTFKTGVNDFLLLPQCHAASFNGCMRAIAVNKGVTTFPTEITCSQYNIAVKATLLSQLQIDICKKITQKGQSHGIRKISVGSGDACKSYNVDGKHLVFRATTLSNLRVLVDDKDILLKGVSDE